MKRILLCAALAVLAHGASADTASEATATTRALQTLAVRAKHALDNPGDKHAPADLAAARAQLDFLRAAATAAPDAPLAQKFRSVAQLVDKLAFTLAQPTASRPAQPGRATLDRETLSATRGESCANALGVSTALPVEVVLAAAGAAGSDAWFRLDSGDAAKIRFTTDSDGPDPALAIQRTCGAAPVAGNDDMLGLDASADVALDAHATVFVHLSNSGASGRVRLTPSAVDATISGTITDANTGQPLSNAYVKFYTDPNVFTYNTAYSDNTGRYSAVLQAGQYYVEASANQHVSMLYPHAKCSYGTSYYSISNCDTARATLVTASSGGTTSGVDIALGSGQRIAGAARSTNADPVPSAYIVVLDVNGNTLATTYADGFGRYLLSAVPDGTYRLRASPGNGGGAYGSQLYAGVTCGGPTLTDCDVTQATPVTIAGGDLLGADFTLQPLSSIHGVVHEVNNTNYAQIVILDPAGNTVATGFVGYGTGAYVAGPLPVGTYYAYVDSPGYFSQLYAGVNCEQNCISSLDAATPIVIAHLGDSPQVDFTPQALPRQSGHVQDAQTNQPLAGVTVMASLQPPANFSGVANAQTDSNGDYVLPAVAPGSYYVWAQSPDHIDQVYPAIACEAPDYYSQRAACDVTGAVLMTVTPSTATLPAMDFSLQPSSQISGNVGVRGIALGAAGTQVLLYDTTGSVQESVNVDNNGGYVIADLTSGTYFALALYPYSNVGYVPQLWQGIDCPNTCVPTQSTPIPVAANTSVAGIDFSLLRRDAVVGHVTDGQNQPLNGVLIDLFDASTLNYVSTAATDAQGNYMVVGTVGFAYYVATEAPAAFVDQIYAGVACPLGPAYLDQCAFTGATAVPLAYGSSQPHRADFTLAPPPDEIFGGNFE